MTKLATVTKTLGANWIVILAVSLGILMSVSSSGQALTIEFGISSGKASRAMVNQGFSQIKIIDKSFKNIEATGCQNGTRYKVKINSRYRLKKTQNLGPCRRSVSVDRLKQNLERSGYTRVSIENQNGKYVAIACRGSARIRITFSQQGEILQRRNIGECRSALEPNDVRPILARRGYNRIRFTDRQLPKYVAEACYESRKVELVMNRFGEIRKERRIGKCAPPVNPKKLTAFLEKKGYERVEIISDQLPIYEAQACHDNDLVDLHINRYGTITSRKVVAKCRKGMSEVEIIEVLEAEGFRRISVTRNGRGEFRIEACHDGYKKYATLSRYGELLSERDGDRCEPRSIKEIQDKLRDRGFRNTEFYAEGCRKGRRIRIQFNAQGERVGRKRLGSC